MSRVLVQRAITMPTTVPRMAGVWDQWGTGRVVWEYWEVFVACRDSERVWDMVSGGGQHGDVLDGLRHVRLAQRCHCRHPWPEASQGVK